MIKTHSLLAFLFPSILASAQAENVQSNVSSNSLIVVTQIASKETELSGTVSNDEGTNNPVVTGSQEYIQGDKKYYLKQTPNITILFEEKLP